MANDSQKPYRIFICAGEISGDLYGAALVRAFRTREPERKFEFYGLGGDRMKEEGVEIFEHASRTGVIGFWEVAKRFGFFYRLFRKLSALLDSRRPDLLLTIDYPGMNLKLAAEAKKRGIRTVHYVCPQVWAWHRERIPGIARVLDQLICFFPFEPALFDGTGLDAQFAGHPLIDQIEETFQKPAPDLSWKEGCRKIALFAGSRKNEVRRILPTILEGAAQLEKEIGPCSFLLPVPSTERAQDVREILEHTSVKPQHIAVVEGHSRFVLREAEAAVVKSGTSTLEAAIIGCPFFIVYRVSHLTYLLLKRLITGVRFIGLVNIVPNRGICKELIQNDLTPEAVCSELRRLLNDAGARAQMLSGFEDVRSLLGKRGATARAVERIMTAAQSAHGDTNHAN